MSKGLPKWAATPFHDFLDHQHQLGYLLELSITGISMLRAVPRAVEVLGPDEGETGERHSERVEHAHKVAQLAQREVDSGFPLLHAQATVSLWSSLECLVCGFLADWLANKPDALNLEPVRKTRISLGEYEAMAPDQRRHYIIELLEREVHAPFRQGVDRFEALLGVFGLSGPVDDDTKRDLFELSSVRNVLVHRRGIADTRFVKACPWLDLKPGDTVAVSHDNFHRYMGSTTRYIVTLIKRVRAALGLPPDVDDSASWPP